MVYIWVIVFELGSSFVLLGCVWVECGVGDIDVVLIDLVVVIVLELKNVGVYLECVNI